MPADPLAGFSEEATPAATPTPDALAGFEEVPTHPPEKVGQYLIDPESGTPVFNLKTNQPLGYGMSDDGKILPYNQQYHGQDAELQAREHRMGQDPNWEGGHGIKPLGAPVGPEIPTPTAQQEALSRPLDSALIPAAGVAAGLATGGVVPTLVGTGLAAATAPAFRENVGKPVENLVSKVLPQAAPYVGQLAEMGAGMGLGAGMGEGTSAGRVTMEDAPAAPISPVERAQASEAEIVPDAQAAPQNGAQRLLEGPAANPEAPAQPQQPSLPPPERIQSVPKESLKTKAFHGVYETENPTQTLEDIRKQGMRAGWFDRGDPEGRFNGGDPRGSFGQYLPQAANSPTLYVDEADIPARHPDTDPMGDYIVPKWHPDQGEPWIGDKEFGNAPLEGGYSIAPHKIHRLLGPDPNNPDNVLVQRLAPEPAQESGPRGLPPPAETQVRPFAFQKQSTEDAFVKGMLGNYPKGEPGLEVTEDPRKPPQYHVVYRGPDGMPVAAAVVQRSGTQGIRLDNGELEPQDLGVTGIAADKSRGLLGARAAAKVAEELQRRGWAKPLSGTEMTPDSLNLMERGKQVEAPPTSVETKPKTDAEYEAEAKASNREKNDRIKSLIKAPAIKMGDKVYAGETGDLHGEIYMRHPELVANLEHKPIESGFIDHEGNFLNQQQAAEKADVGMVDALNLWPEEGEAEPYIAPSGNAIDTNNSPSSTLPQQSLEDFQEVDEAPPLESYENSKGIFDIPTNKIAVAPDTFQYKVEGIDPKTGAGESGRGAEAFDYGTAPIALWHDSKGELGPKGQLYVAHGHHRYSIANRTGAPVMRATIWDSGSDYKNAEFHNVSKEEARARGAVQNFRDRQGTALDAATYLRDTPNVKQQDLVKMGVDPKSKMMQQAVAMQHLTAPVWYQASIGKLPAEIASTIGKELDNPRDQVAVMKAYQQKEEMDRPFSAAKFHYFVQRYKNADHTTTEDNTLFGKELITRSTFDEEADIMGAVARKLGAEGTAFGTAAKKKDLLEKGQNVINKETSQALSKEAKDRLAVLNQYGSKRGTYTDVAIKKFARHLAEKPSQRKAIIDEATEAIIKAIDKDNPGMPEEQPDEKTGSLF